MQGDRLLFRTLTEWVRGFQRNRPGRPFLATEGWGEKLFPKSSSDVVCTDATTTFRPKSEAASKEFPTPLAPSTADASSSSDGLPMVQLVPAPLQAVKMTEQVEEEVLHRDLVSDSEEEVSSVDSAMLATACAARAREVAAATPVPSAKPRAQATVLSSAVPGPVLQTQIDPSRTNVTDLVAASLPEGSIEKSVLVGRLKMMEGHFLTVAKSMNAESLQKQEEWLADRRLLEDLVLQAQAEREAAKAGATRLLLEEKRKAAAARECMEQERANE